MDGDWNLKGCRRDDPNRLKSADEVADGWHLPSFMTPETKWGYDYVNCVNEPPEESYRRMEEQIKGYYPEAGAGEIRKVLKR